MTLPSRPHNVRFSRRSERSELRTAGTGSWTASSSSSPSNHRVEDGEQFLDGLLCPLRRFAIGCPDSFHLGTFVVQWLKALMRLRRRLLVVQVAIDLDD